MNAPPGAPPLTEATQVTTTAQEPTAQAEPSGEVTSQDKPGGGAEISADLSGSGPTVAVPGVVPDEHPPSEPDPAPGLRFGGTYLLTSGPQGPTAVPDLVLELDDSGVALSKADATAVWRADWDGIAGLATPERSRVPDGGHGVVVVITERSGRSHRFVVPARRPARVESALDTLARGHDASPERPERSLPVLVVVAVVVLLAAALALLLLAAGHIIHL